MLMLILGMGSCVQVWAQAKTTTAANSKPEILNEKQLSSKFVSAIQGTNLEDTVYNSGEFKTCADKAKFDPSKKRDDQFMEKAEADALTKCFKEVVSKKNPDEIQKLSSSLNLQGYQLVRSNSVQDITSTLTNKLYKKLTGIDLDDSKANLQKRIDSLKFSNPDRKLVDQKDFMEMYRIELGKSALYEISRFCFTNLRRESANAPTDSFANHWVFSNYTNPAEALRGITAINGGKDVSQITDVSSTGFGTLSGSTSEKEIYGKIKDSIYAGGQVSDATTAGFFETCMGLINPLCSEYRKEVSGAPEASSSTVRKGSNACLTQQRLIAIRTAMTQTSAVIDDVQTLATGKGIKLSKEMSLYNPTDAQTGYNAVTTLSSKDFLDEKNKINQDLVTKCDPQTGDPSTEECKQFLIQDDSYKKAIHDTEVSLRLKGELEAENLLKLKNSGNLETYLEKSGYFDLLTEYRKMKEGGNAVDDDVFRNAVTKYFDAQRKAALENIQASVGKRQVEKESSAQDVSDSIKLNVQASQEERARLAQVVLFTNIVTSSLSLQKKGQDGKLQELGKNTTGIKAEISSINGVDPTLFTGLNSSNASAGEGANNGQNYLKDIQFLDEVLGKTAEPAKN